MICILNSNFNMYSIIILSVISNDIFFQFISSPGWPSSFSFLDVKESPGGVAVGCYTRRVTDRAWTGIQSGGETPEGNAATMVREREFDSPGSDKIDDRWEELWWGEAGDKADFYES